MHFTYLCLGLTLTLCLLITWTSTLFMQLTEIWKNKVNQYLCNSTFSKVLPFKVDKFWNRHYSYASSSRSTPIFFPCRCPLPNLPAVFLALLNKEVWASPTLNTNPNVRTHPPHIDSATDPACCPNPQCLGLHHIRWHHAGAMFVWTAWRRNGGSQRWDTQQDSRTRDVRLVCKLMKSLR